MEDTFIIAQEATNGDSNKSVASTNGDSNKSVASSITAVFDGHGGPHVSSFLEKAFHSALLKVAGVSSLSEVKLPVRMSCQILHDTLYLLDHHVLQQQTWNTQGSTALVSWHYRHEVERPLQTQQQSTADVDDDSLFPPEEEGPKMGHNATLIVANIGDSRAVLGRVLKTRNKNNDNDHEKPQLFAQAVALTSDHKPDAPEEKRRILNLGGRVTTSLTDVPRVNGILALSRAIGDGDDRPFVSSQPDLSTIGLASSQVLIDSDGTQVDDNDFRAFRQDEKYSVEDEFIVLATDGLWDVMNNSQVVELVAAHDFQGTPRDQIPQILTKTALKLGSYDNITVVIEWLGGEASNQPKQQ